MRAAILSLLVACASCATPTASNPDPFTIAERSSVEVTTYEGLGSGTIVSDKCVLTAAHVVENQVDIAIVDRKGKSIKINHVSADHARDLALICADKSLGAPPIVIADSMPQTYQPVFIFGYPLGLSEIITTGLYEGHGMVSAPAAPGNSGGGVFDASGNLVGVLQAIAKHGTYVYPHLAYIAELNSIKPFLRDTLAQ